MIMVRFGCCELCCVGGRECFMEVEVMEMVVWVRKCISYFEN